MDYKKSFSFIGILALLVLSLGVVSAADYTETFDNSLATASYADDSFVGDNNITWDYEDARNEGTYEITGNGMIFRDATGKIYSSTISGGIGTFSVKLKKASATVGDRQVELFINTVSEGTSALFSDDDLHTFTVSDINIEGDIVIEIKNILDKHVVIDTITWTDYTATPEEEPFCEDPNEGNLEVEIKHVDVEEGFGDDDNYWYPLDKVEIDVEIENNGEWDVEDIELKICLLDVDEGKCIMDEDDMDLEDDKFDLDEGDDITITVKLDVDPRELEEGNKDYIFQIKATGEIDDSDSSFDKDKTCSSDSQDIEIRTDEKFLILDKITATDLTSPNEPGKVSCGSEVLFTANVWNVGDDKIKDDKIFIWVYNKDLGIQETIDMEDISSLDKEELSFRITIPENLDKKFYVIEFGIYDDEDLSDSDLYENSEDDEAIFEYVIEIAECGIPTTQEPTITANLLSEAKVGEELIVQVSITNNGAAGSLIISAVGFEAWAESASVEPVLLYLDEGETGQVTVTLNPTKAGAQTFNIQTIVGGETSEQAVSVSISEKTGFMTGAFAGLGNTGLYIISIVVLILIIIIIALIVKVKSVVPAEF